MNILKQKIKEQKPVIGTHVRLNDSAITELLSNIGFDYIWVDTEHSAIDYGMLQLHLIAARAGGTPAIVRIPQNDAAIVKRVLDLGADGIIFPMNNSAEQARTAMESCIYPPDGTRGVGPTRASMYSLHDLPDYIKIHRDVCRFIQVEHAESVRNIEEIVRVPYLDGIIIGPCDLSASIGRLGEMYCEENIRMIKRTIEIAAKAGIPVGVSLDSDEPEVVRRWAEWGITFISCGMDFTSILRTALTTKQNLLQAFDIGNACALR